MMIQKSANVFQISIAELDVKLINGMQGLLIVDP